MPTVGFLTKVKIHPFQSGPGSPPGQWEGAGVMEQAVPCTGMMRGLNSGSREDVYGLVVTMTNLAQMPPLGLVTAHLTSED